MRRKIIIVSIIAILSTGFVFAANVNGTFEGLPVVNVKVKGETLESDVPGVVFKGRTLLPARAIAESLNAIVSWDQPTMTAHIIKPEVNMIFVEDIVFEDDDTWTLKNAGAGIDSVGKDKWVYIFYEIGPMEKQLYTYRVVLVSPDGEILAASDIGEAVIDNQGLLGAIFMYNLTYKLPGNYTYQFQMKYNDKFETVEDIILVVE